MQKMLKVRLRDILGIELLADAEILAGHAGLDNEITSVNVWEVPDIAEWVRRGELLLTTAYPVTEKIESLHTLLPILKEKGVCGIGIKTKRYIEDVPDDIVHTANSLDFPIIRIAKNVSFGDLIRDILAFLTGEQTRLLEQINTFNEQLKAVMAKQGGLEKYAEQIYEVVQSPLVICDDIFKRYSIYTGDEEAYQVLAEEIEELVGGQEKTGENLKTGIGESTDMLGGNPVKRITIPTYFDNIQYGKIIVWDLENKLNETDIFVIESASSLIALNTITRLTLVERENLHYANFIEQLLSNDPIQKSKALSEAEYFEFHPELDHQCVVLSLNKHRSNFLRSDEDPLLKSNSTILLRVLEQLRSAYSHGFISASKANEAIFFLEANPTLPEKKMAERCEQFCDLLFQIVKQEKVDQTAFIGVGRRYPGYANLAESFQEAGLVVKIMENGVSNGKHIARFEELGLLKIFGQPELRETFLGFANDVLKPLTDYDSNKDGELIDTVKAYFTHGGNFRRISEDLFTHYNTVIYRVNRIRELLHVDLKDPDTAFNLQLALRIKDLLE